MRLFIILIATFFLTTFVISTPTGTFFEKISIGLGVATLFTLFLLSFDLLFSKLTLRTFNVIILGIFFGYLMGRALVMTFNGLLEITQFHIVMQPQTVGLIKTALLLFGIYIGSIITLRSAEELYVSIPFVKFALSSQKKKDLLIDLSALADARIIDLATTGLLDHQLIIPRFMVRDLNTQLELTRDELVRNKLRKSLDTIKKLEEIPHLDLHYDDTDFPEVKDLFDKLIRLARFLNANLLTADMSRIQTSAIEGVRIINIHSLSNALKPLMEGGESIKIKIQRYGKEPRQGVGYLEDGTMVVVNGGGDYIGEMVDAHVLSVKHTSSGRIIFCNAVEKFDETVHNNLYSQ